MRFLSLEQLHADLLIGFLVFEMHFHTTSVGSAKMFTQ